MNTPHRPSTHREAEFRSTVPFSRSGMRLFNGLGCSVSCSAQATLFRKATWSSPWLELHGTVGGLGASSRDLPTARGPLKIPRSARWHQPAWLRLAHLDVMSLASNIFAPFGAVPRISRTARRMAHDLLCAALLLLLGCLRPARARRDWPSPRLAYAALRTSTCCSTPPPRSHQRPHGPV